MLFKSTRFYFASSSHFSSSSLWPPLVTEKIISTPPTTTEISPPEQKIQQLPPKKLSLIGLRRLQQQQQKQTQQQQQSSSSNNTVTSFFDEYYAASKNESASRSILNPMRLHIHSSSTVTPSSSETPKNNMTTTLLMTKAQKKLQNRLAKQQQQLQDLKTRTLEQENRLLVKRVSILDDDDQEEARNEKNHESTVPVREYTNGRVGRRTFNFLNEKWCSVCNEPVEMYLNHIGRKDHSLLDQHFEGIVEYDRTWLAHKVLTSFENLENIQFEQMQNIYAVEERLRRVELNAMLSHLVDVGAVDHANHGGGTNRTTMFGVFLGAHLALHYIIPSVAMSLYPAGSPDQCSNIEDFVSSSYNMETAYDMCDFKNLPGLKERQQDRNQVISSVNAKMNVVRILLAQLKPAILMDDEYQQEVEFAQPQKFLKREDYNYYEEQRNLDEEEHDAEIVEKFYSTSSTSENNNFSLKKIHNDDEVDVEVSDDFAELDHKMNKTAAMETLMGICGRSLVAELVHCRISEYVVRAERPWMGIGKMEQIEPGLFSTPAGSNPPLVKFDLSSRPESDATPWKLRG